MQKTLTMNVQHNNGVPEIDELAMETVTMMGVVSADESGTLFVYVNDVEHTDFTYDRDAKVQCVTRRAFVLVLLVALIYRIVSLLTLGYASTNCTSIP